MTEESIKTLLTSNKEQVDSKGSSRKVIKIKPQIYKREKEVQPLESNLTMCSIVSFISEVPEPIKMSMEGFIESHPNWDQYRFIQAAVAKFLIQHGIESRSITRIYIENVFPKKLSKGDML